MNIRFPAAFLALSVSLAFTNIAAAQLTDVPGGGMRSRGAVIPQQGPVNQEAAGAVDNALGAPPANADPGASPGRSQNETQQEWEQLRKQEQARKAAGSDGQGANAAKGDSWRYVRSNNHWWYWQPNNSWVFYHNSRWVPFDPKTYGQYYTIPAPPRASAGYRGAIGNGTSGQ